MSHSLRIARWLRASPTRRTNATVSTTKWRTTLCRFYTLPTLGRWGPLQRVPAPVRAAAPAYLLSLSSSSQCHRRGRALRGASAPSPAADAGSEPPPEVRVTRSSTSFTSPVERGGTQDSGGPACGNVTRSRPAAPRGQPIYQICPTGVSPVPMSPPSARPWYRRFPSCPGSCGDFPQAAHSL